MIDLNPKQQALAKKLNQVQLETVLGVVAGKTQRQAYLDAGGKGATNEAVDAAASKLLSLDKVRDFKNSLLEQFIEKAIWTRLDSERVLAEIALGQDEQGKTSDRVAAVKELNSMGGWNAATKIAQTDTAGNDVQPVDVNAALVAKLIDKLVD